MPRAALVLRAAVYCVPPARTCAVLGGDALALGLIDKYKYYYIRHKQSTKPLRAQEVGMCMSYVVVGLRLVYL